MKKVLLTLCVFGIFGFAPQLTYAMARGGPPALEGRQPPENSPRDKVPPASSDHARDSAHGKTYSTPVRPPQGGER